MNDRFGVWLAEFKKEALGKGVSQKTIDSAFRNVKLNLKLPDLEIPSKKIEKKSVNGKAGRQPEFADPGSYFPKGYLDSLSQHSRKIYRQWKDRLAVIEKQYGVEAEIVLSVWGRETSFGRTRLPFYAVEVLATQAFIGRRKDFFRNELLIALQILEQGHVKPEDMKSSWAGAMGFTQFMPDDFRRYAVDFDRDGRSDIWKNIGDALASTANYLHKNGWKKGRSWGFEVRLPRDLDCRLEGFDRGKTIAEWQKLGISGISKKPFDSAILKETAYLLIPAGIRGPAFLVSDNFLVLKTYNQANLYALFVGHLADRISVNGNFRGKWPKMKVFARDHIRSVQEQLAAIGYDIGKIDGIMGPKSRSIIGDFQKKNRLAMSCYPNKDFFTSLNKKYREKSATVQ